MEDNKKVEIIKLLAREMDPRDNLDLIMNSMFDAWDDNCIKKAKELDIDEDVAWATYKDAAVTALRRRYGKEPRP